MTLEVDPKAIPRTYRDYLDLMQREGEFLAIDDEVDWYLEIGAILRRAAETLSPSPWIRFKYVRQYARYAT